MKTRKIICFCFFDVKKKRIRVLKKTVFPCVITSPHGLPEGRVFCSSAAPRARGFIYKTFCAHSQGGEGMKKSVRRGPQLSTGKVPSDLCQCLPFLLILLHTERPLWWWSIPVKMDLRSEPFKLIIACNVAAGDSISADVKKCLCGTSYPKCLLVFKLTNKYMNVFLQWIRCHPKATSTPASAILNQAAANNEKSM